MSDCKQTPPTDTSRPLAGEVTHLLRRASAGDASALEPVFERLYPELRRLAASRLRALPPGSTVTPTVLVHDAYLRFVGSARLELKDRSHFFALAGRAMRQILVDRARRANSAKRGGEFRRVTLPVGLTGEVDSASAVLDMDRALDDLAQINPRALQVVELRFFAGCSAEEAAELMEISLRTANREWQKARLFLQARLGDPPGGGVEAVS